MSKDMVHLAVDLTIHEGKLDEFQGVARTMIAGSQKEPGTLAYDFFLSDDRKRCRLIESYTNADALLAHFTGPVVQQLVPKLLGTASLTGFEVYGDPGPEAAQMLKGFGAQIFDFWDGVSR
ncbi:MAG: putative quinol monooxygenase [Acidobacteriota bacterium]|nr:putative quinol monooxygenase [Acidobacteriota bacterium]